MKDSILWDKESDAYTKRAEDSSQGKLYFQEREQKDVQEIIEMLPGEQSAVQSILDIGCGFGNLTGELARRFPHAKVVGVDPGEQSIAKAGKELKDYQNLSFLLGHSHELPVQEVFDLVILRMVLQWIPREYLQETVAEIDRVCRQFVFIQDFYPNIPASSVSVHNADVRIFKQDYTRLFTANPLYKIVYQKIEDIEYGDDFQRGKFLLRKYPLKDVYLDKKPVQEKDKQ